MSMHYYRGLLGEADRIEAFRRALAATIRPGDRVLEIGAGLGTFSFFAADAGAHHVWAVDGHPVIGVAKTIGMVNGYRDRVTFLRGWIPDVTIPERCDVVVFEDFPSRLMDTRGYRLFRDVHERYLTSPVRAVPCRATVHLALVASAATRKQAFGLDHEQCYGIDWTASRDYVANLPHPLWLAVGDVIGESRRIGEFRFDRLGGLGGLDGSATWTAPADGQLDGLAYWFDLELAPGVWLSNAPGASPGSWGHVFLPVDPPLRVTRGDTVWAEVARHRMADGTPGWMTWTLRVAEMERRGHEFRSFPAAAHDLVPFAPDDVPELTPAARHQEVVLRLTDGSRSIRDIVDGVRAALPELDPEAAEQLVLRTLRGRADPTPVSDRAPATQRR